MNRFQTNRKMKTFLENFSRKLINKINWSLAIIYNSHESSHDSSNINIDDSNIQNITNDNKTNDSTILQKNPCNISDNDAEINILCNSELFNMDYNINTSPNNRHVDNFKDEVSLTSKLAK